MTAILILLVLFIFRNWIGMGAAMIWNTFIEDLKKEKRDD